MTDILLDRLTQKTDRYQISRAERSLINTAAALHDIGKITIDDKILNKPGRLTKEEFDIMKTHTLIGAEMLDNLDLYRDEPLVKIAYQICRWHHERYDGKGYPDGLVGDQIPISAQVVSLADVYAALTSKRGYKDAYPDCSAFNEDDLKKAIQMIMNGECGVFNPLLLECLLDVESRIQVAMNTLPPPR